MMLRDGYERDDWRRLQLNDAVEDALCKILRFGFDIDRVMVKPATADALRGQILAWAKHIARDIPGYNNWQEIYDFTFEVLYTPDAVPGSDARPIGTEADLVATIVDIDLVQDYALQDKDTEKEYLADHALSLNSARTRQSILDHISYPFTAANPMPLPLAHLFRKIRYTYKLRECLLGQVGYYNGALELATNMDDEFDYHIYLIQMKLRRPDRLHVFKAPKQMAHYVTGPTSPLPWNNQFSLSYAFDKFGPLQMPVFGINYIERRLVEVLRLDVSGKKWKGLCTMLNWNPNDPARIGELHRIRTGTGLRAAFGHFLSGNLTLADCGFRELTLPHFITIMDSDELKRKVFYTLFLELTWTDTPFRKEMIPFAEEYEKRAANSLRISCPIEYDLAHLMDDGVKDSRIPADRTALLLTLNLARYYPHVVGSKAIDILTPETAGADYRRKLERLSEADLDQLFDNIAAYPRGANRADKIEAVITQALGAARDWQTQAVANHRPFCTGPSGHMISYSRIFLDNIGPNGCAHADHPTLEQLRLTLLAALIGFNRHHTYDECMTASHGLTDGGTTLKYTDPIGYRDILNSEDPFVREEVGKPLLQAITKIGQQFIAGFEEYEAAIVPPLPHPGLLVAQWFKDTTGRDFPAEE